MDASDTASVRADVRAATRRARYERERDVPEVMEARRAANAAYYQRRKADPEFKARRNEAVKRFYERNPDKRPQHIPTDLAVERVEECIVTKMAELELLHDRYHAMLTRRGEEPHFDDDELAAATD